MVATIRLKEDELTKIRKWTRLDKDSDLAAAMKIDGGNLSRVLRGKQQPGTRFIAALMQALEADFDDLFELGDDSESAA